MATVISPIRTEKSPVPDFYPEPATRPLAGESTIPTEIPLRVLKGMLIGLVGAIVGIAMMWIPISSHDTFVVWSLVPQVAMTVMIVTGYLVGIASVMEEKPGH